MREKDILDVAVLAGEILLKSGAEIFRVEETMARISSYYGITKCYSFVLSSGIFITAEHNGKQVYAKVKHIPLNATHLEKVAAVNQLSREIVEGRYSLEAAREQLEFIQKMPGKKNITRICASGLGAGCFCYIFGGNAYDAVAAFIAGFLMYIYIIGEEKRKKKTSKVVNNIVAGVIATLFAVILCRWNLGNHLNFVVIGSIFPLLPGVSFTNAIRDLTDGNYIGGIVRLVDALIVTFAIALGVGFVYTIYYQMVGKGFI